MDKIQIAAYHAQIQTNHYRIVLPCFLTITNSDLLPPFTHPALMISDQFLEKPSRLTYWSDKLQSLIENLGFQIWGMRLVSLLTSSNYKSSRTQWNKDIPKCTTVTPHLDLYHYYGTTSPSVASWPATRLSIFPSMHIKQWT